jgi:fluoroacetyl-CoA thioesterase
MHFTRITPKGDIMKETLQPGIEYEFKYRVPASKTVPALYPEAEEFQVMPNVFATGFLVGFIEWVCIQALLPHLDWPAEQTVGTQVNISHMAATPPGMEVQAKVKLVQVKGKQLFFEVEAHDQAGIICKGTHERFVINAEKFNQKLQQKVLSM